MKRKEPRKGEAECGPRGQRTGGGAERRKDVSTYGVGQQLNASAPFLIALLN